MKNLTQRQTIAIGIAALFGVPICIGLIVGHFLGFWTGFISTVFLIVLIAFIAQRWWYRQAKNKGKDNGNKE